MENQEIENVLKACIDLVIEQYVMPLTLALGAVTTVVSRDPKQAAELSEALRAHAESCSEEVAGRKLLEALAELAGGREPSGPGAPQSSLRKLLWLPRKDEGTRKGSDS